MKSRRDRISQINIVFLSWLSAQDDDFAASIGIDPDELRQLRRTPWHNIDAGRELVILLDKSKLQNLLKGQRGHLRNAALAERAVRLGARLNVVRHYIGISNREYGALLQALGLKPPPRGRIALLDAEELSQVLGVWNRLIRSERHENGLELFCLLSERSRISLDRIYATLGRRLQREALLSRGRG